MPARLSSTKPKPQKAPNRATMRDVAQAAGGVHPSTVSLALRNSPRISAEARAKIQAAARRIGYRRDPLLDAFNKHRLKIIPLHAPRHIVALADFASAEALGTSPHHVAARAGALEAAADLHCKLDFMFCGAGRLDARRIDAIMDARGQRALLLFGLSADSPPIDFTWSRLCVVAIDSVHLNTPLNRVTPDYRQAARLLWQHAWSEGCRRIAIVRSHSTHSDGEDRAVAGFLLEQANSAPNNPIPVLTLGDERIDALCFKRWLRKYRPEVVLHFSAASSVLARMLGNQIVRSFALDSCGADMPGACPDYAEVGRRAVQQLVSLMQTNQRGLPHSAVCTYVPVGLHL